jgi:hypothetical protein
MDPADIVGAFRQHDTSATAVEPVSRAMEEGLAQAGESGTLVVCGSLFVCAEAREHILGVMHDPPILAAATGVSG